MASNYNDSFAIPKSGFWNNIFKPQPRQESQIIEILRDLPLFAEMNNDELIEFRKILHFRNFKTNEPIFWEGDPGVGMYIILEGIITVCRISAEKGREVLAELRAGDFFGEIALIDDGPRPATCIVKESAKIAGLFRPDLVALIEKKPRLGNKFLFRFASLIGKRTVKLNAEIKDLRGKLEAANIII